MAKKKSGYLRNKRIIPIDPLPIDAPFVKGNKWIEPGVGKTMDLDTKLVTKTVKHYDPRTHELISTDYYQYQGRLVPDKHGVSRIKRVGNRMIHLKTVTNILGGGERMDISFDSLMEDLHHGGVSLEDIAILRRKWSKMSSTQKAKAWNSYRRQKAVLQYGSSSSYSSTIDLEVSGYEFYDALEDSMDAALRA